jgi:predicted Zn-ribbon and HTH transcriptional regulator
MPPSTSSSSNNKRPASPLTSSPPKRPKPTLTHPNLLLHQRLNTLQEALTSLPHNPSSHVSALLARATSLGRELDAHFRASSGVGAAGASVCPAVGCGLKLSKTCHLRRHVRTKAVKCRFHAEVLTVMNATSCRHCGRSFTRREDVTRHEGRCGECPVRRKGEDGG